MNRIFKKIRKTALLCIGKSQQEIRTLLGKENSISDEDVWFYDFCRNFILHKELILFFDIDNKAEDFIINVYLIGFRVYHKEYIPYSYLFP